MIQSDDGKMGFTRCCTELLIVFSVFFGAAALLAQTEAFNGEEEKARLVSLLREELEPTYPPEDVQKLKREVRRLGSYNAEWSGEASDFLVANAAAAELYLYDFSRISNQHLNARIIETLLRFESYRYPLAPLAFAESLANNTEEWALVWQLFNQVLIKTRARAWAETKSFLFSSSSMSFLPEQKLFLALSACEQGASLSIEEGAEFQQLQDQSFWSRVLYSELNKCVRRPG